MSQDKPIQIQSDTIDLNVLIKFIKPFDGSRNLLTPFITNCSNAYNLASTNQKHIIFKFIISQLQGRAEAACSIKEFSNWDQLKDFLTTQFGERKCYSHLLTDLQECRQYSNETVTQYSLRVETCLSHLLTEITLSNSKKMELAGKTSAMEDIALNTFVLGLHPRISNNVRVRSPKTLNEAINAAISEEKILQFVNRKSFSATEPNSLRPRTFPKPDYKTHEFRPNFGFPHKPRPVAYTEYCRYCKNPGHVLENCRKREYNNKRFNLPQNSQNRVNLLEENEEGVVNADFVTNQALN